MLKAIVAHQLDVCQPRNTPPHTNTHTCCFLWNLAPIDVQGFSPPKLSCVSVVGWARASSNKGPGVIALDWLLSGLLGFISTFLALQMPHGKGTSDRLVMAKECVCWWKTLGWVRLIQISNYVCVKYSGQATPKARDGNLSLQQER